jgi:DNA-binding transcriptional MerR regulator
MIYSIGQVAKMLGVSRESLRSWERQGFIPKPMRILNNLRRYTDADIEAIKEFLSQKNLTK